MPVTADQHPGLLGKESLTETTIQLFADMVSSEFPLLALFPEKKYKKKDIRTPIFRYIRSLAAMHAAEAPGDVVERMIVGESTASPFFFQEKIAIPSGYELSIIEASTEAIERARMGDDASDLDDALEWLSTWLLGTTLAQARTQHKVICDVLSWSGVNPGDGTYPTVTIDGVSVPLNYGLEEVDDAGVDWSGASNDILTDFVSMLSIAELDAGDKITDVVVSKQMVIDYVFKNDYVQSLIQRRADLTGAGTRSLMEAFSSMEYDNVTWHVLNDVYTDSAGANRTHVWPKDRISFISNRTTQKPGGIFEMATCRTRQNDFQGGRATYSYETNDAKALTLVNSTNGVPLIKDPLRVRTFELTP